MDIIRNYFSCRYLRDIMTFKIIAGTNLRHRKITKGLFRGMRTALVVTIGSKLQWS